MLTILMVLAGGVYHPTYAWIDELRYSTEDYRVTLPLSAGKTGITAKTACLVAVQHHKKMFPSLQMKCVTQI